MPTHKKIDVFTIPDQSNIWNGNECYHSMWGVYLGDGKLHKFYCTFCALTIKVNFPRWMRCLKKTHKAEEVIAMNWVCPSCCKTSPVLTYVGEYDNTNSDEIWLESTKKRLVV